MSQLSLGETLGEGGAGIVYDGTWQGQKVAIKKLPGRFTRAADQEMQLISKLRHDNVVRYYTVEKSNTAVFLVMELISGGTLFDYIQRQFQKPNYWPVSYKILQDIAIGMNYLCEQNIIHGDLKSHNILLRKNNNQAVICDFGLSKTLTTALSHMTKKVSIVQGTTRWLAPELCRPPPERLSHESDVWAFGCVILEITSGDLPWINRFEKDDALFFALQDSGSRQGPIFAHECATQKAPTKIRELLCSCCTWSKKNRPNFSTIMQTLNNISTNDLKDITQPNKSLPAPPTEALSRMSLRTRQEDDERRAREERERKERRDRSEEDRRRRREQDRRDEERRADERRCEERRLEERRADERRAEERRAEERRRQEQQEQEWKASQRHYPSGSRRVVSRRDSSDSDGDGGGMRMPFGGGGMMMPFGGDDMMTLFGGGGGLAGFGSRQSAVSTGLPSGARYTGQLYASNGSANGRPLIQGPRGGTFYMTSGGNKRYI